MHKSIILRLAFAVCGLTVFIPNVCAQTESEAWNRLVNHGATSFFTETEYEKSLAEQITHRTGGIETPNFPGEIQWIWATLEGGIGRGLLDSADFLRDGQKELITTSGPSGHNQPTSIFVLSSDLDRGVCRLGNLPGSVQGYYIFQIDSEPELKVLVATQSSLIMMDGATCAVEYEAQFPGTTTSVGIGDVDGDGVPNVAFSIGGDLFVAPWDDLSSPMERRGFGGSRMVLGQLERDGADDIVVVANNVVFVLRGDTLATLTEIPDLSATDITIGDINGDGSGNIIIGTQSVGLTAFAAHEGGYESIFNVPVSNPSVVRVQDVTGDGQGEVLYGPGQFGDLYVLDGEGVEIHRVENPGWSPGMTNILATDFDGNGVVDLFWGVQSGVSGNHLYRGSMTSEDHSWRSRRLIRPFQVAAVGPHAIAVSHYNSSGASPGTGGGWNILDPATGSLISSYSKFPGSRVVTAIATERFGNHGLFRVCLAVQGTSNFHERTIECFDPDSGDMAWTRTHDLGNVYYAAVADVDGDGEQDLLLLGNAGRAWLYNAASGFLKWQSENLSIDSSRIRTGFNSVAIMDDEIWFVFNKGEVRKVDPVTGDIIDTENNTGLTHIAYGGDDLYGLRSGEGVGLVDPETFEFTQAVYESTADFSTLTSSADGEILMVSSGSRPNLESVLISTDDTFSPWNVGQVSSYGEFFTDSGDLVIGTRYGAKRVSLDQLLTVFRDRFQ